MKKQATLKQIKLAFISLTRNNPRKFDKKPNAADAELYESIAAQGVIVPVHVRNDPKIKEVYELLAGERRYRAAKAAGLDTIPAIDHGDISDAEAFEITFAENFLREDLTTLEHGRAVAILLSKYKDDFAAVSSKLGKRETWVRQHNCIETNLIAEFRKLASAGGSLEHFTAAHLGLIARFPAETQKQILKEIFQRFGEMETQVSVKELQDLVTQMIRLLSRAKFDTEACGKCLKRSGVQPGLWTDSSTEKVGGGDRCLDPACWEKKEIAAEKKKFNRKAEKYPGLVAITKDYGVNQNENRKFKKIFRRFLYKGEYEMCNKDVKSAVPAMLIKGKGKDKIYYIKINKDRSASPAANKPVTLKQRREELDKKRWGQAVWRIVEKIKSKDWTEIFIQNGGDGEMLEMGLFRMNLLIVLYGCDCAFYGKDRDDFFESTIKLYKNSTDISPAINQVCEKLWPEVTENIELGIDACGDKDSKIEGRLLAELFGMDLDAEYHQVCSEPEFAEPAEWANLKADGTPKKVKSEKAKVKKTKDKKTKSKTCRVCGCTDTNACLDDGTGQPCHWVEDDLCSKCHEVVAMEN